MSDTHPSNQPRQGGRVKDVPHHAVRFALVESSLGPASDDTTGILATMLQQ